MDEYSIESKAAKIYHRKTRSYFAEVESSYREGNYRSSVVMLWSVAICDILFKLKHMIDMYGDTNAQDILSEVQTIQSNNERSSEWELKLIELTKEKTPLLNVPEFENLKHLQRQRHLSAHPVMTQGYDLHTPNRDSARALIRNTLDDLLVKPPFYTREIFSEFLADLAASSSVLIEKDRLKKYIESKYLLRIDERVEAKIFRSLWKIVFRLDNPDCESNRKVNYWALEVLYERSEKEAFEKISGDKDYYGNIAKSGTATIFLIYFLSRNPKIYAILSDDAKIIIKHVCDTSNIAKCISSFLVESLEIHSEELISWIKSDKHPDLDDTDIQYMLNLSESPEWRFHFKRIMNTYYGKSQNYDEADARFEKAIKPFLHEYDEALLVDFLEQSQNNQETYGRRLAQYDHRDVKEQCIQTLPEGFDYSQYPSVFRNV